MFEYTKREAAKHPHLVESVETRPSTKWTSMIHLIALADLTILHCSIDKNNTQVINTSTTQFGR